MHILSGDNMKKIILLILLFIVPFSLHSVVIDDFENDGSSDDAVNEVDAQWWASGDFTLSAVSEKAYNSTYSLKVDYTNYFRLKSKTVFFDGNIF